MSERMLAPTLIVLAKEPVAGRVKTRLVPPLTLRRRRRSRRRRAERHPGGRSTGCRRANASSPSTATSPAGCRRVGGTPPRPMAIWMCDWRRRSTRSAAARPCWSGWTHRSCARPTCSASTPPVSTPASAPRPTAVTGRSASPTPGAAAAAIRGVPMSVAETGAVQLRRLHECGLRVQLLPTLVDVDTIDTAVAGGRSGAAHRVRRRVRRTRAGGLMEAGALAPYEQALRSSGPLGLHTEDGRLLTLDVARWLGAADDADRTVLDRCRGPVLDVGCGPGRLVCELNARGVAALGVDIAETAVALTRGQGFAGPAAQRLRRPAGRRPVADRPAHRRQHRHRRRSAPAAHPDRPAAWPTTGS